MDSPRAYVRPPGYAAWPKNEAVPTVEEADNPLFDFSDFDNVRKLARAISSRNDARAAGQLSGELSYAYRDGDYDNQSISESLTGLSSDADYQAVIDALKPLAAKNVTASTLLWSVTAAQEQMRWSVQQPMPSEVWEETERNKNLPWHLAGAE